MTGLWLVSYLVLWGLVVVMGLFLVGILRQLGLVYRQLDSHLTPSQESSSTPTLQSDGPVIGSPIPDLEASTINGFGILTPVVLHERDRRLLVFMSPMCKTCQHIVEPLNALASDAAHAVHPIVIMRA